MSQRVLTIRELNRATLARQLLLERRPLSPPRAIERLCAVQAQWPTAPYVALWSRVRDFRREALTRALERRTVLRTTLMRVTLHLLSARDYPVLAPLWRERRREEFVRGGGDVEAGEAAIRAALAEGPRTYTDLLREVGPPLDRRPGPLVPLAHVPPAGTWRHHGRTLLTEAEIWLDAPFGEVEPAAELLVERYLAGYGPASKADLLRFAGLRAKDVAGALESLEPRLRRLRDEDGRELLDLRGAPLPPADTPAPPRFLGRWDNVLIGYARRARILPDAYADRKIGLAGDQVFLVDGLVAGIWVVERGSAATIALEALAPLPRTARRALEDEADRLVRWHEPDADAHRVRWS